MGPLIWFFAGAIAAGDLGPGTYREMTQDERDRSQQRVAAYQRTLYCNAGRPKAWRGSRGEGEAEGSASLLARQAQYDARCTLE